MNIKKVLEFFKKNLFPILTLFVAIILGLPEIFNLFEKRIDPLEATIEIHNYPIPKNIKQAYSTSEINNMRDQILDTIKRNYPEINKLDIRDKVDEILQTKLDHKFFDKFYPYTLGILTIKNTSKKIVNDIKVDTDYSGFYEIIYKDETIKNEEFDKDILLDDLGPSNNILVYIWIDEIVLSSKKIKIVHQSGFIIPSERITVGGIYAWIGKRPIIVHIIWILYFSYLIIFFYRYYYYHSEKRKQRKIHKQTLEIIDKSQPFKLDKSTQKEIKYVINEIEYLGLIYQKPKNNYWLTEEGKAFIEKK